MNIILDTDIGDDIDDAYALALICASPELNLLGVTTVFGNVAARARQARTVLKVAGEKFAAIPVAAGCGASLSSRPIAGGAGGTAAYLSDAVPSQDASCLPEDQLATLDSRHGVQFLLDNLADGTTIPVTIGAMTNLAVALTMERRLAQRIPRIVAMAGEFKVPMAEWNVLCDPEAAAIVCDSGIPIDFITWTAGRTVSFGPEHLARLRASSRPMAKLLAHATECWGPDRLPALYDPLAVATLVAPHLVEWRRGTVTVELQGASTYGYTGFIPSDDGPHRIVWEVDREAALDFYLDRVLAL